MRSPSDNPTPDLEASCVSPLPPRRAASRHRKLALVLPGGGARAAYQAGVLRGLGRLFPDARIPILTGVSAGAINAVFLAAHPGNLQEATEDLAALWEKIQFDDIFRVDLASLLLNAMRWLARLALGGSKLAPQIRGLLDTEPLRRLLERELQVHDREIEGIARNIQTGRLLAIALLTVNYGTGQTISWVEGCEIKTWERPERRARSTRLTVEHVMASSSLPLAFPAIALDGGWFGDGGIRLAAPLSPALHLGAERVLAISTRYPRSDLEADRSAFTCYPPPAQIAGNLMNSIFLDVVDQDVRRLERMNLLLNKLPPADRQGLKPIAIEVIRPSQDLGKLSADFEHRLPRGFRFFSRGLGTRETESPDYLSLLMFHPDYIRRLIEIGERDAEERRQEIATLMDENPDE